MVNVSGPAYGLRSSELGRFEADGFLITGAVIDAQTVSCLLGEVRLPGGRAGRRDLLTAYPSIAALSRSQVILGLVESIFHGPGFPVRAILFDKNPDVNWTVSWHQDLAIPLEERLETPGFQGWSKKEGVWHAHPPVDVLERMVTARIHLDDCHPESGPLCVLPGSHREGRMSAESIEEFKARTRPHVCEVRAGEILLMRPLLLHASESARFGGHRRVIHIEYGSGSLPGGLRWAGT